MKWTRAAVAVVGMGLMWPTAGLAVADDGPGGGVNLLVNGAFDNRPGELIDIDVRGVRAGADVTVSSPVFDRPVRLAPSDGGHHARPAVEMSTPPGTYPLKVEADGKIVAREQVEVKASERPTFQVTTPGDELRPGEQLGMWFDDLYPGETGDAFTVRSPAFPAPIRLTHDPKGADWNNPRMFSALVRLPADAKDGTYKVELTGPDGRTLQNKDLVVRAARPGDSDYVGKARGPAFFSDEDRPEDARSSGAKIAAGGSVNVLWSDESPDPGEEGRLTATSPAFERAVRLKRDDSKAGDGDDPRYYGPARVRTDLESGRYPVTVVSHHGRVKRTGHLVVAGSAPTSPDDGPDRTVLLVGAGTGGAAVAAAAGVVIFRRVRSRS
ncbi:hypothetical protein ACFY41_33165 [Streptomyces syringium]|uniref:hypothetical protein n=1 Tax=Streptomyces syringium TaxID=76729 RepID=UPI00369ABCB7